MKSNNNDNEHQAQDDEEEENCEIEAFKLIERKVRKNGFSLNFTYYQIISWMFFIIEVIWALVIFADFTKQPHE